MDQHFPFARTALIANIRSRRGDRLFGQALELLRARGIEPFIAHAERKPRRLRAKVEEALAQGADLIMLGGGDGSVSATIGAMQNSEAAFAPLPFGTANSFVRTLGAGVDLETVIDAIVAGRTARVDLAEIDGHTFANSAAIGLSPLIGETIPHKLKRYLGRIGYLVWALRTFMRFRPFRVSVSYDGKHHECWASEVRMLNGQFLGGVQLTPDALLDNGRVVVQIVSGISRWQLAGDWARRMVGLAPRERTVVELSSSRFEIATRPPQKVSIDGEVLSRTPIALSVHPRAVRVIVPPQADAALSAAPA